MKRVLCAVLLAAVAYGASSISSDTPNPSGAIKIASAVDREWWVAASSIISATASPYQPGSISSSLRLDVVGYTGVVVRAKYPRAETISTAPVVYVWGRKGSDWTALLDSSGTQPVTLSSATTDCDDGTTYKWTNPSNQIDVIGCTEVVATIATAGAASSGGAMVLEITRF